MKRHRHVWKVETKFTQPSAFDQLARAGISSAKNLSPDLFRRDVIVTYRCAECGQQQVMRV